MHLYLKYSVVLDKEPHNICKSKKRATRMNGKMEGWLSCESTLRLGLQAEKTKGEGRHNRDL